MADTLSDLATKYLPQNRKKWDKTPAKSININIESINPLAGEYAKRDQIENQFDRAGLELEYAQAQSDINKLLGKALTPSPEGITRTAKNVGNIFTSIQGVGEAGAGALDTAKDIGGAVAEMVMSGAQAISPGDIKGVLNAPGAGKLPKWLAAHTPDYIPTPANLDSSSVGGFVLDRAIQALEGAPFVKPLKQAYKTEIERMNLEPGDKRPQAPVAAGLVAVGNVASSMFTDPLRVLLSGEVPDPQDPTRTIPASIRDTIHAATTFYLAADMVKGAMKRGPNLIETLEGKDLAKPLERDVIGTGELTAAAIAKDAGKREAGARLGEFNAQTRSTSTVGSSAPLPTGQPSSYPQTDIAQALRNFREFTEPLKSQMTMELMLDDPYMKSIQESLIVDPVLGQLLVDRVREGSNISGAAVSILKDPNLVSFEPPGTRNRALTDTLVEPEMRQALVQNLPVEHGVGPEIMQQTLAAAVERTTHESAQVLQSWSETLADLEQQYQLKLTRGTTVERAAAADVWDRVRELQKKGGPEGLGQSRKAAHWLTQGAQKFEQLRVGLILAKLPSAINIAKGQGVLSAADLFDALNAGIVGEFQKGIGRISGSDISMYRNNWSDLAAQIHSIGAGLPRMRKDKFGVFQDINELLTEMPLVSNKLNTGLLFDTSANLLGRFTRNYYNLYQEISEGKTTWEKGDALLQKSLPTWNPSKPASSIYNTATIVTELATMPLRLQEAWFRKLAFRGRLESNLTKMGMKFEDLLPKLREVKFKEVLDEQGKSVIDTTTGTPVLGDIVTLDPAIREAVADATLHALRQTWAADPVGGVLHGVLKGTRMWNSVSPIQSSMIFTPFIKAMANNVMWQAHHSPINIAEIFKGPISEALSSVGTHKLTMRESRDMQRRIGQGMTGMTILVGSLHAAAGGQMGPFAMGPKPWLLNEGEDRDESGQLVSRLHDLRGTHPELAAYMTVAKLMTDTMEGRESNIKLSEIVDILSNTNVESMPFLQISDILRYAESGDPDAHFNGVLSEGFGRWIAPFGNILKTFREDYKTMGEAIGSGIGISEVTPVPRPMTQNAELVGPLLAAAAPNTLPVQVNPFTGRDIIETHPVEKNINIIGHAAGKPSAITPFEDLMTRTPGVSPYTISKKVSTPEGQRYLNRATGQILNDPTMRIDNMQIQDLAKGLVSLNSPDISRMYISILLPVVHEMALAKAMQMDIEENNPGGSVPPHFTSEFVGRGRVLGNPRSPNIFEDMVRKRLAVEKQLRQAPQ